MAQKGKPEGRRGTKVLAAKGVKRTEVTKHAITPEELRPKVRTPARTKGLVLKGTTQVIPRVAMLEDGTPDLPHPPGLAPSPVRSLTVKQMAREERERGGVAAELTRRG